LVGSYTHDLADRVYDDCFGFYRDFQQRRAYPVVHRYDDGGEEQHDDDTVLYIFFDV